MMEKINVIATDLDETLLNDSKEISYYSRKIIEKIIDKKILFVPCTSRSFKDIPPSLLDTSIRYFICSNGASIWDKETKSMLLTHNLDIEIVKAIINWTKDVDKVITLVSEGSVYSEKTIGDLFRSYGLKESIVKEIENRRTLIDSIYDVIDSLLVAEKIHFNHSTVELKNKSLSLIPQSDKYILTTSHPKNIEITNILATKGNTLIELCNMLAIKPPNIIAFGDNLNDVSLLEVAKIKVAMKNGHETLKEIATNITEFTSNEDGVAHFLEDYLKDTLSSN